jgi:hypothetical protein
MRVKRVEKAVTKDGAMPSFDWVLKIEIIQSFVYKKLNMFHFLYNKSKACLYNSRTGNTELE